MYVPENDRLLIAFTKPAYEVLSIGPDEFANHYLFEPMLMFLVETTTISITSNVISDTIFENTASVTLIDNGESE